MGKASAVSGTPPALGLASALFTHTQQRVLGLIFGQPDRDFALSELIATSGAGSGAVQRELAKLVASGLVVISVQGTQKRYRANACAPIHDELVAIVRKTVAMADPIREALSPLADRIVAAFIYGSIAKRRDHAGSDIDLMIVSDTLSYAEVMLALHPLAEGLGREINPTLYALEELQRRLRDDNAFVTRVLDQPKLWLIGGDDDLRA